jgi:hypothetical protein
MDKFSLTIGILSIVTALISIGYYLVEQRRRINRLEHQILLLSDRTINQFVGYTGIQGYTGVLGTETGVYGRETGVPGKTNKILELNEKKSKFKFLSSSKTTNKLQFITNNK